MTDEFTGGRELTRDRGDDVTPDDTPPDAILVLEANDVDGHGA